MTLFSELVKHYIPMKIREISELSAAADHSFLNLGLGTLGMGRDTALASAKRDLISTLLSHLNVLLPAEEDEDIESIKDDSTTLKSIHDLILSCRAMAKDKSSAKGYDEGSFGPAMQELINLTQAIFEKLITLRLINIPFNHDPLNIFRFFITRYCVQKMIDTYDDGPLDRLVKNPKFTEMQKLSQDKMTLVLTTLQECTQALDCIDASHPRYLEAKQKCVLTHVKQLRWDNRELCNRHATIPLLGAGQVLASLRPSIPFLGAKQAMASMKPCDGLLDELMAEAQVILSRPVVDHEAAFTEPPSTAVASDETDVAIGIGSVEPKKGSHDVAARLKPLQVREVPSTRERPGPSAELDELGEEYHTPRTSHVGSGPIFFGTSDAGEKKTVVAVSPSSKFRK